MNTVSILIICGFAYLVFVTWMFGRKGSGQPQSKKTGKPEADRRSASPAPQEPMPLVPKSDFNMEDFKKAITDSMTAAMTYVLNAQIGDVTPEQVTFDKSDEKSGDNAETDNTEEQDPDIVDADPDRVSPPATGDTLEEIEAALNTAADSKSSPDEKAKAGKILAGMRDVVFIGKIMACDERINEGIMSCVAESMRRHKPKKKGSPTPKKKNSPIDVGGTLRDPDMIKRKKDDDED